MTWHVNIGSFCRGICVMKPLYKRKRVLYSVRLIAFRPFWFCLWTPVWHEGRGPYISIGLGIIAFCRGY